MAKAERFGGGHVAYVSAEVIGHLRRWLQTSGPTNGAIFRSIQGETIAAVPLRDRTVASILKTRGRHTRLDAATIAKLSGHSMRVGAAQDMAATSIDLGAIMHASGWKSSHMAMRFIEHMYVKPGFLTEDLAHPWFQSKQQHWHAASGVVRWFCV